MWYLSALALLGLVWFLPYRSVLVTLPHWYLLPFWIGLGHLHSAFSHVLATLSFRKGRAFLVGSFAIYGRLASGIHLQAAFLVAIVEEILFRGILLQSLMDLMDRAIVPLLLTSVLFSAAHLRIGWGWPQLRKYLDLFIFALLLGVVTLATRSIYPAILIHGTRNYILRCLLVSREEYEALKRNATSCC